MPTTTISSTKKHIERIILHSIETGVHMPTYMHSSPGLGKSAIMKQICKTHDLGFVDVRLAQLEQADVAGIPYVAQSNNEESGSETMKTSIPEWFPSVERVEAGEFPEKGVVFFDEMSNAPIPVQHAAYRIVLDREIHRGCDLAPGWVIVSAGNKKTDKTGAKGVAPALANRYAAHFDIRPDLDDFRNYAVDNGLNDSVVGFLSFDASKLYMFDPNTNDVAFATPRSWEQVSNLLDVGYTDDELPIVLGGCIGDAVTSEFMAFRKYYAELPNFENIMAGKETYKVPTSGDRGIIYAVTSSLITNLVENAHDTKKIKNLETVMTQLSDEFLIMLYKTIKGVFASRGSASNDKETYEEASTNIFYTTMDTFSRVIEYISEEEIKA